MKKIIKSIRNIYIRNKVGFIGFLLIIISGISLLLIPEIFGMIFNNIEEEIVCEYSKTTTFCDLGVQNLRKYNDLIYKAQTDYGTEIFKEIPTKEYYSLLDNDGIMGYVEIPKLDISIPIFHGTDPETLEFGLGHLYGSSLPIGATNSNVVLSGHSNLREKELLTNIDSLETNDIFYINVFQNTFVYKVVEIQVIEPDDFNSLLIQKNKDLVTLMTCTPYGINSHRLLVIGERTSEKNII